MNHYPKLREEKELIIITQIREREKLCKEQIILLNESQLTYMNNNHKDFIGFPKFSKSIYFSVICLAFGTLRHFLK